MSFRDKMKVPISRAEVDIHVELTRRHLYPESQYKICLSSCTPDFFFHNQKLCVFIDGAPHEKAKRIDRDNGVDDVLRRRGFKVARFPYRGKLSKTRLNEICNEIQELVK